MINIFIFLSLRNYTPTYKLEQIVNFVVFESYVPPYNLSYYRRFHLLQTRKGEAIDKPKTL